MRGKQHGNAKWRGQKCAVFLGLSRRGNVDMASGWEEKDIHIHIPDITLSLDISCLEWGVGVNFNIFYSGRNIFYSGQMYTTRDNKNQVGEFCLLRSLSCEG